MSKGTSIVVPNLPIHTTPAKGARNVSPPSPRPPEKITKTTKIYTFNFPRVENSEISLDKNKKRRDWVDSQKDKRNEISEQINALKSKEWGLKFDQVKQIAAVNLKVDFLSQENTASNTVSYDVDSLLNTEQVDKLVVGKTPDKSNITFQAKNPKIDGLVSDLLEIIEQGKSEQYRVEETFKECGELFRNEVLDLDEASDAVKNFCSKIAGIFTKYQEATNLSFECRADLLELELKLVRRQISEYRSAIGKINLKKASNMDGYVSVANALRDAAKKSQDDSAAMLSQYSKKINDRIEKWSVIENAQSSSAVNFAQRNPDFKGFSSTILPQEDFKKVLGNKILSGDQTDLLTQVQDVLWDRTSRAKIMGLLDTGMGKSFLLEVIESYIAKVREFARSELVDIDEKLKEVSNPKTPRKSPRKDFGSTKTMATAVNATVEDNEVKILRLQKDFFEGLKNLDIVKVNLASQDTLSSLTGDLSNKLIVIDEDFFIEEKNLRNLVDRGAKIIRFGASQNQLQVLDGLHRVIEKDQNRNRIRINNQNIAQKNQELNELLQHDATALKFATFENNDGKRLREIDIKILKHLPEILEKSDISLTDHISHRPVTPGAKRQRNNTGLGDYIAETIKLAESAIDQEKTANVVVKPNTISFNSKAIPNTDAGTFFRDLRRRIIDINHDVAQRFAEKTTIRIDDENGAESQINDLRNEITLLEEENETLRSDNEVNEAKIGLRRNYVDEIEERRKLAEEKIKKSTIVKYDNDGKSKDEKNFGNLVIAGHNQSGKQVSQHIFTGIKLDSSDPFLGVNFEKIFKSTNADVIFANTLEGGKHKCIYAEKGQTPHKTIDFSDDPKSEFRQLTEKAKSKNQNTILIYAGTKKEGIVGMDFGAASVLEVGKAAKFIYTSDPQDIELDLLKQAQGRNRGVHDELIPVTIFVTAAAAAANTGEKCAKLARKNTQQKDLRGDVLELTNKTKKYFSNVVPLNQYLNEIKNDAAAIHAVVVGKQNKELLNKRFVADLQNLTDGQKQKFIRDLRTLVFYRAILDDVENTTLKRFDIHKYQNVILPDDPEGDKFEFENAFPSLQVEEFKAALNERNFNPMDHIKLLSHLPHVQYLGRQDEVQNNQSDLEAEKKALEAEIAALENNNKELELMQTEHRKNLNKMLLQKKDEQEKKEAEQRKMLELQRKRESQEQKQRDENDGLKIELQSLQWKKEKQEKDLRELQDSQQQLEVSLSNQKTISVESKEAYDEYKKQRDALASENISLGKQIADAEDKIKQIQAQIDNAQKNNADLESTIARLKAEETQNKTTAETNLRIAENYKTMLPEKNDALENLTKQVAAKKAELEVLMGELQAKVQENGDLLDRLKNTEKALTELAQQCKQYEQEIKNLEGQIAKSQKKDQELDNKLADLHLKLKKGIQDFSGLSQVEAELTEAYQKALLTVPDLEKKFNQKNEELEQLKEQLETKSAEDELLQKQIAGVEQEIEKLKNNAENSTDSIANYERLNALLEAVIKEQNKLAKQQETKEEQNALNKIYLEKLTQLRGDLEQSLQQVKDATEQKIKDVTEQFQNQLKAKDAEIGNLMETAKENAQALREQVAQQAAAIAAATKVLEKKAEELKFQGVNSKQLEQQKKVLAAAKKENESLQRMADFFSDVEEKLTVPQEMKYQLQKLQRSSEQRQKDSEAAVGRMKSTINKNELDGKKYNGVITPFHLQMRREKREGQGDNRYNSNVVVSDVIFWEDKEHKIFNDVGLFGAKFSNCRFLNIDFSEVESFETINFQNCVFGSTCKAPNGFLIKDGKLDKIPSTITMPRDHNPVHLIGEVTTKAEEGTVKSSSR